MGKSEEQLKLESRAIWAGLKAIEAKNGHVQVMLDDGTVRPYGPAYIPPDTACRPLPKDRETYHEAFMKVFGQPCPK